MCELCVGHPGSDEMRQDVMRRDRRLDIKLRDIDALRDITRRDIMSNETRHYEMLLDDTLRDITW